MWEIEIFMMCVKMHFQNIVMLSMRYNKQGLFSLFGLSVNVKAM